MLKPFTIGLPNTCSSCGKPPGKVWYAENEDQARSGGGICKGCLEKVEKRKEVEARAKRLVEKELAVETDAGSSEGSR